MIAPIKRRRGRPKNPGNEGLVSHVHIRLSAEQKEAFELWAGIAGMSLSNFLRREIADLMCCKKIKNSDSPTTAEA